MADDGLVVSPSPHDFGNIVIGSTATVTLTLKNINDRKDVNEIAPSDPLLAEPFSYFGGGFPGTGGTCTTSSVLAPGQSCTVVVRFFPSDLSTSSASLVHSYRLQNAPKTVSTSIRGTGAPTAPALAVVGENTYDFFQRPIGHTARKTFALKNTGMLTATGLTALPLSGPFSIESGTCVWGGSLSGGSSCTFVALFTATTETAMTAKAEFTFSGSSTSAVLNLGGQGQVPQTAGLLDFSISNDIIGGADGITSLALLEDDTIVAGGFAFNASGPQFAVSRYRANGSLDSSFNGTGSRIIPFSNDGGMIGQVMTDLEGKIVAVGSSGGDFAFVRLTSSGDLDTSFNSTGTKLVDFNSGSNEFCSSAALDSTGKIVAAGYYDSGNLIHLALTKLRADGTLDTSFNSTGKMVAPFGTGNTFATSVAIQPDGKVVVGGTSKGASNYDFFVARYRTDGVLDPTFNGTGYRLINLASSHDKVTDVLIDSKGSIVLAGRFISVSGNDTVGLGAVKMKSDGSLDDSFASGGIYRPPGVTGTEVWTSVRETTNGDYLFAYYVVNSGNSIMDQLLKLDANGTAVSSFGVSGILKTGLGAVSGQRPGLVVQADGKVLIGGRVMKSNSGDFAIERRW